MNVLNKVTLQSLKKNRVRTVVTVIGIMLSAAMICAVTTFVSSIQNYVLQYAIYADGDWHGSESDADFSVYEEVCASKKTEKASYLQRLGYAYAEGCTNEYKPYLYVLGASDISDGVMPVHLVSGEYPKNADEIILPEHLSSNGGVQHKIGDTLTLELGERMLDGYPLNQDNPCSYYDSESGEDIMSGEELEVRESRTYTVVGFYERLSHRLESYQAPGYTAFTVADAPSDGYRYDVFFKMKNAADVYDFMKDKGYTGGVNTDVLAYQGVSSHDNFRDMLGGMAAVVIGLIIFGSVSLIYNAFSISVSERTKQFGLLSSIGATKKQLRGMVIFEALAVSAVGIPLGIAVGIGGIAVTLLIIGNKFASVMNGFDVPMRICVSWEAVVIAAALALLTVLISAWIPSRRATAVTAVEAIRQSTDIRVKNKPQKTPKLTYKLFGLPGVLASKHYKRSKKKYRATVVSLFMSIVLFVSASAFTGYLMESVTGGLGSSGFDLIYSAIQDDLGELSPDALLELIKTDGDIKNATYSRDCSVMCSISEKSLTEKGMEAIGAEKSEDGKVGVYCDIYFIPDSEFEELLSQNGLKKDVYMNPDAPLAIAFDGATCFNHKKEKLEDIKLLSGDKTELECSQTKKYDGYAYAGYETGDDGVKYYLYESRKDTEKIIKKPESEAVIGFTLRSGKTLYENRPYYIPEYSEARVCLFYPESLFASVIPEELEENFGYFSFYMTSSDHEASFNNLKNLFAGKGVGTASLYDYAASVEQSRNIVIIIQVFSYGFIVLISLIAAANVFNTISTNISLRRREFAMLKSVGMTKKGFMRMMNFECLLYGSRALLFGLPVSFIVTFLIYLSVNEGYETGFCLPWGAVGIAVLSVFAVVFVTMMYSMRKIKKDNPIDALKNENL